MKNSSSLLLAFVFAMLIPGARAANIVWVSDANDTGDANTFRGFFPAGTGYTDSGFTTLLQNAGHNVIRYNQPNSAAQLLTQEEIDALNTNDLIIMSRAVASGALQPGTNPTQGPQWNTAITAPLMDISAFHVRANRLGWFSLNEAADDTPTALGAVLTGEPATDAVTEYLFGGVPMIGTNMAVPFDIWLDRGSTPVLGVAAPGGTAHAGATYITDGGTGAPGIASGTFIASFPAGTVVRAGNDTLGGYRMFFSAGSRESATAPNSIPLYTARENLSPAGENIFLRAVEVAINEGVAPATNPNAPIVFTTQPGNTSAGQGSNVLFTALVTGAGPRTLQWQRDTGDGVTFTNIPDAFTSFGGAGLTLSNLTVADNNAKFRVEATNPQGTVLSSVATLTVTPDTAPPIPLLASTLDGMTVVLSFNELLDNTPGTSSAEEEFNYTVDGESPLLATLRPDGRSVELSLAQPVSGASFPATVVFVSDRFGNGIPAISNLTGITLSLTNSVVGTLVPAGSVLATASNVFEITAGGLDMASTSDNLRFLHQGVTGDFDARVRVVSLAASNRIESVAKAVLSARATTEANSAAVNVIVMPSYPADDAIIANVRPSAGAATNLLGVSRSNGLPNVWLRIKRVGDVFTTYRSANGSDWVQIGSTNVDLGPSALVGMGVVSHRNNYAITGTFADFQVSTGAAELRIVNARRTATAFNASFDTQAGVTYVVEYNNDLNTSNWQTLTTVTGTGNPYTINDTGPLPARRFYRVRVQ